MRMLYKDAGVEFELRENLVNTVTVEAPKVFRQMVGDIWNQSEGEEGGWILSQSENELSISKVCEVVINPFFLNLNDKKMVTALYNQLKLIAETEQYEATAEINSNLYAYIDGLISTLPYSMTCDMEVDMSSLFKTYHVRLDEYAGIDGIIDYLRLRHQVIGIQVIIWINGKQYMTKEEFEEVYRALSYEKVQLVILEGSQSDRSEYEESLILDKDLCII